MRLNAKFMICAIFVALLFASLTRQANAQTVFCPAGLGLILTGGSCTDGNNGAYSGAMISSSAMSSLSQTTTQQSASSLGRAINSRREEEQQRKASAPPARPRDFVSRWPLDGDDGGWRAQYGVAAQPQPGQKIVKGPAAPIFAIEPTARYGTWAQVYGDYEHRSASGSALLFCCGFPARPNFIALGIQDPILAVSVQSQAGMVGFMAGADVTTRDVLAPDDGVIVGVTAGYANSTLALDSSSVANPINRTGPNANAGGNTFSRLDGTLSGLTAGLYAAYFSGAFSADLSAKFDAFTLSESFNEVQATTGTGNGGQLVPVFGGGSVGLLNSTVAGNLNYRYALSPNLWIEPTVGSQYTRSSYGWNAFQLGLADGDLVMVQWGARLGMTTLLGGRIPMTTVLTGLAYDDVSIGGGFISTAAYGGNNLLVRADEGKVRGKGGLALAFDLGDGFSSFIQGEVRGGQGLIGAGGKAGIRYQW